MSLDERFVTLLFGLLVKDAGATLIVRGLSSSPELVCDNTNVREIERCPFRNTGLTCGTTPILEFQT